MFCERHLNHVPHVHVPHDHVPYDHVLHHDHAFRDHGANDCLSSSLMLSTGPPYKEFCTHQPNPALC